ncbi:hypothetical protein Cni_G13705 [Canna indica]|uniref:Endonuclease/exonuclease/phosphatase domain-containing protein n=1 Tax=Canna indica TaxID=4628 RepID=A0AAQ3KF06_9LILI|nr:hypothetical protein Cni_G13705 [Canna indica]
MKREALAYLWFTVNQHKEGLDELVMNVFKDDQSITIVVMEEDGAKSLIIGIYASNNYKKRNKLWNMLGGIDTAQLPWIIIGDMNCIRNEKDKLGGRKFEYTRAIKEFNNFIEDTGLLKADFIGPKYTWSNNRKGEARVQARLDRVLFNDTWLSKNMEINESLNKLTEMERRDAEGWLTEREIMEMEVLTRRAGAIAKQIHQKWWSKARCKWVEEGEKNTRYFHNLIKIKRKKSKVEFIEDNGQRKEGDKEMADAFATWYEKLWEDTAYNNRCKEVIEELNWKKITEAEKRSLVGRFREEEFWKAACNLGRGKSLGNDETAGM